MQRVYCPILAEHIDQIKRLAFEELDRMLNKISSRKYSVYRDRLIAICICQGFAQHFVETHENLGDRIDNEVTVSDEEIAERQQKVTEQGVVLSGIKDIDVWFFFEDHPQVKIPNRNNMNKSIYTKINGIGEVKIDFLKKGIKSSLLNDSTELNPESVVRNYLVVSHTKTSWHLQRKSVLGLYPETIYKRVIWRSKRIKQVDTV
jgi:hypothetical protein